MKATAPNLAKLHSTHERKQNTMLAPVWEGIEYPHYPPGIYDVRCNSIQGPEWLKNHRRWSIRLECNFLMEEGTVSGFLNLGGRSSAMCELEDNRLLQALVQGEWRPSAKRAGNGLE